MEDSNPEVRRLVIEGPFDDEQMQLFVGFAKQLGLSAVESALDNDVLEIETSNPKIFVGKGAFIDDVIKQGSNDSVAGRAWSGISEPKFQWNRDREAREEVEVYVYDKDGLRIDFPYAKNNKIEINELAGYMDIVLNQTSNISSLKRLKQEVSNMVPGDMKIQTLFCICKFLDNNLEQEDGKPGFFERIPEMLKKDREFSTSTIEITPVPVPESVRIKADSKYLDNRNQFTPESYISLFEDFADELGVTNPRASAERSWVYFTGALYTIIQDASLDLPTEMLGNYRKDPVPFYVILHAAYVAQNNEKIKINSKQLQRMAILIRESTEPNQDYFDSEQSDPISDMLAQISSEISDSKTF